jgi:hypothetical protein
VGGVAYKESVSYDSNGRLGAHTSPAGLQIKRNYNTYGHLEKLTRADTGALLWQAKTVDAEGRLISETLGNNLVVDRVFHAQTGRLTSIKAHGAGGQAANLAYGHDALGNLVSRTDSVAGIAETLGPAACPGASRVGSYGCPRRSFCGTRRKAISVFLVPARRPCQD